MLPLSEKLRPNTFEDIAGQTEFVQTLKRIVQSKKPLSLLFFGPPGCGKTTLARIYAKSFNLPFVSLSAVFNSTAELKKILKEGHETPLFSRQTLVFIDEIHRFNRAQQDIFLPFLEDGSLILVGATTENPSFALNNALLSRLRVLKLEPLSRESLKEILSRYEKSSPLSINDQKREEIIAASLGDARHLLNMIENLERGLGILKKEPLYDKNGDGHYNLISALHKSVRHSDPDAALYWLARMLSGGEDPLYIARRLIRMAVEDIGLAEPNAQQIALNGWNTYNMLGSPEGELALAQVVVYLALSPKSRAVYVALDEAKKIASQTSHLDPPLTFSGDHYFPEQMERASLYHPLERGFEREMKKRLEYFKNLRLPQSNS